MRTIDSFGQLKIDDGDPIRARVIEIDRRTLAAFPEADPATPILITGTDDYWVKGRHLYMDLLGDGQLEFRRASCGCQTPLSLRGPRSQFLDRVPAPAEP